MKTVETVVGTKSTGKCFLVDSGLATESRCGRDCKGCEWTAVEHLGKPRLNKFNFQLEYWETCSVWSCLNDEQVCPYRGPCWSQWRATPRNPAGVLHMLQIGSLDSGANQSYLQQMGFRLGVVPELLQRAVSAGRRPLTADELNVSSAKRAFEVFAAAAFGDALMYLEVKGIVEAALKSVMDLGGGSAHVKQDADVGEVAYAVLVTEMADAGRALDDRVVQELAARLSTVPENRVETARLALVAMLLAARHAPVLVSLPDETLETCADLANLAGALINKTYKTIPVDAAAIGHACVVAQSMGLVGAPAARATADLLKAELLGLTAAQVMQPSAVAAVLAGLASVGATLSHQETLAVSRFTISALNETQRTGGSFLSAADKLLALASCDNLRRRAAELKAPTMRALVDTLSKLAVQELYGLNVDLTLYYHYGHTWIKPLDSGKFAIGLDDFAIRLAGKVDKVGLPKVGARVQRSAPFCWLGKGGREVAVTSPVSGTVLSVNTVITDQFATGEFDDQYETRWLLVIEPDKAAEEAPALIRGRKVVEFQRAEIKALLQETSGSNRAVSLDGAALPSDMLASLPPDQWARIAARFFKA